VFPQTRDVKSPKAGKYHIFHVVGPEQQQFRDKLVSLHLIYPLNPLPERSAIRFGNAGLLRILYNWNDDSIKESKIAILARVSTWNTLDHLLILNFEGFVVEHSDEN